MKDFFPKTGTPADEYAKWLTKAAKKRFYADSVIEKISRRVEHEAEVIIYRKIGGKTIQQNGLIYEVIGTKAEFNEYTRESRVFVLYCAQTESLKKSQKAAMARMKENFRVGKHLSYSPQSPILWYFSTISLSLSETFVGNFKLDVSYPR